MNVFVLYSCEGTIHWDATSPSKEAEAYLKAFHFLKNLGCYDDLIRMNIKSLDHKASHLTSNIRTLYLHNKELELSLMDGEVCDEYLSTSDSLDVNLKELQWVERVLLESSLYLKARKGCWESARDLLLARIQNDYEGWVLAPLQP